MTPMQTQTDLMKESFGISRESMALLADCEAALAADFAQADELSGYNTIKILSAFREVGVSARHFNPSTGYGYDDEARDKLDRLFANVFKAEAAIVSPQIASGTHAITIALFGLLRPSDRILFATGMPYDTLRPVIGAEGESGNGSLKDFGIVPDYVSLKSDGTIDIAAIIESLSEKPAKAVYFQRSRGYEWRSSLSVEAIGAAIGAVKERFPQTICVVDNCYGEFCEKREPTEVGADVIIGSLIKNAGGGLAPTGGYIAGAEKYINLIAQRLTCPGIGREIGSYYASYLPFYQGLYFAPHITGEALKGAMLTAELFGRLGYEVCPAMGEPRPDITQSVKLGSEEVMLAFMRAVQSASPVDSMAVPYPWDMPGYSDKVVMAAGTFIQGASIELSADGPVKEPYIAYFQGGLSYHNIKLALLLAADAVLEVRKK